jgi:hypothetical protein
MLWLEEFSSIINSKNYTYWERFLNRAILKIVNLIILAFRNVKLASIYLAILFAKYTNVNFRNIVLTYLGKIDLFQ